MRNARHGDGAQGAGRLLVPRVEVRPEPTDHSHDDGEVEEHVRQEDRRDRPDPRSPAAARRNAAPDDDRRQHERHGDQREHEPPAPEGGTGAGRRRAAAPATSVSAVLSRRLPGREPQRSARSTGRSSTSSPDALEPAAQDVEHRPGEEDHEEATGAPEPRTPRRHRPRRPAAVHRGVRARWGGAEEVSAASPVHASIHSLRLVGDVVGWERQRVERHRPRSR